jgi:hypothetical protein
VNKKLFKGAEANLELGIGDPLTKNEPLRKKREKEWRIITIF